VLRLERQPSISIQLRPQQTLNISMADEYRWVDLKLQHIDRRTLPFAPTPAGARSDCQWPEAVAMQRGNLHVRVQKQASRQIKSSEELREQYELNGGSPGGNVQERLLKENSRDGSWKDIHE
jgi:hypothetical protein